MGLPYTQAILFHKGMQISEKQCGWQLYIFIGSGYRIIRQNVSGGSDF